MILLGYVKELFPHCECLRGLQYWYGLKNHLDFTVPWHGREECFKNRIQFHIIVGIYLQLSTASPLYSSAVIKGSSTDLEVKK